MKKTFCIILVGIVLFISGCAEHNGISDQMDFSTTQSTASSKEMISTTQTTVTSKTTILTEVPKTTKIEGDNMENADTQFPLFTRNITIHKVFRETFDAFLEKPSYATICAGSLKSNTYPKDGDWYMGWSSNRMRIQEELIDFTSSKESLSASLSQKGLQVDVQGAVLIDVSYVPLTIWVKTAEEPIFITVNEDATGNGETYAYKVYPYIEYREKFRQRNGKLIVKGTDITEKGPVKLYYRHADLPLLAVMEALGATVQYTDEKIRTILFQNETYTLNLSEKTLISQKGNRGNLLLVNGGTSSVYEENGAFMVNDAILCRVLNEMGDDSEITFNMNTETVAIG